MGPVCNKKVEWKANSYACPASLVSLSCQLNARVHCLVQPNLLGYYSGVNSTGYLVTEISERRHEHASVTKTVTFVLNTQLRNGKGDGSSTWPFVSHRHSKFCRHDEGYTYARQTVL